MRDDDDVPCCETKFWVYSVICVALVAFAGITSGLSLGPLSFSQVDLEVLIKAGRPQDQKNAVKILPIVRNPHLLLCTLLIGKSLAIETLPLFLDSITPAWAAILISVTLVLAFGEIIPQAVCARYGLSFGARLTVLVRLLLFILYPVSYPISKLLDWLLGKGHSALMRRAELKTLVDLHGNEAGRGGELSRHETTIITGALDMTQKTAKDAMTPLSKTFSLDINSKLDMNTMRLIASKGHSRIPIYSGNPTNIIGLILVKNLIFSRPEDEIPVKNVTIRRIPRVYDNWPLYDVLNQYQTGHSHMAAVVKSNKNIKETMEKAEGKLRFLGRKGDSNSKPTQAEWKGNCMPFFQKERHNLSRNTSNVSSLDHNIKNSTLEHVMEEHSIEMNSPSKTPKQGGNDCISLENLESLSNDSGEEVVGIITMEDVLEELLQEEILDETDVYVDVHNKMKINLLSPRRLSPRSHRAGFSRVHRITPVPSPLSSYHTPLRSPTSPYIQSPLIRQALSGSPGISVPNSPAGLIGPVHSSPSAHRVTRKLYEKLRPTSGG